MNTQLRAVIYARVSQDKSGVGRSVEQQVAECKAQVSANGWAQGPVITDNDISASQYSKTKKRPGYQELLGELRPGDVLVVWEQSRAARRLSEFAALRDLCADRGVLLCSGGEVLDLTQPSARLSSGVKAVVAEHESDQTRERVRRSVRARAAAGEPHSVLPFGYRKIYAPDGSSHWEADPIAAPLIRELTDGLLTGKTLYAISKDWNARGIAKPGRRIAADAGKPWEPRLLRQMIENPAYAALRVLNGQVVGKGNWPALITEDEHQRIKALFADPARKSPRGSEVVHLLTGIAVCWKCEGPVRYIRTAERYNRGDQYRCERAHVSRQADDTDKHVISEVLKIVEHWKADTLLFDLRVAEDETGEAVGYEWAHNDGSDYSRYRAEASALKQRLTEFEDAALAGDLPMAALVKANKELTPQIEALEEKARGELLSPILAAMASAPEIIWENMTLLEQRDLIRRSARVTILPAKKGARKFDPGSVRVESILPDRSALTGAILRGVKTS
ncbi:recombinase family protein [Nocardia niigatensis]|uniref:recombinase family protein n=1 Tax=Nocardia niigatensis TaxID=209249 RepID=UPI0002E1A129|nr:recombinase family protein [Nocardia niigatensis]